MGISGFDLEAVVKGGLVSGNIQGNHSGGLI